MWLSRRRMVDEIMDDEGQSQPAFAAALRDLERVNRLSFGYRPTLQWLDRLVAQTGARRLSVLDVGAGGGDMLRQIAAWGARRGVSLELTGLDRSPWAEPFARAAGTPGHWITADLFDLPDDQTFDVIICGLFAHHLPDPELVRFLAWMDRRARLGWLINDLHRHPVSWIGVWTITRLLRLDPMVIHDGPASIARGFSRADFRRFLAQAGVTAEIHAARPFRWAVGHIRQ